MRTQIIGVLYSVVSLVSFGLGSTYILRDTFMPYHAEALQQKWQALDGSLQVLLLALMDVAGAGWITLGLVLAVLIRGPFRAGRQWARYLIPAAIIVFYTPTLVATLNVTLLTPATAPWQGNAVAIFIAVVGLLVDAPWASEGRSSD